MPEIPASAIEAAAKEADAGGDVESMRRAAFDELGMVKRETDGKQKIVEYVDSGEQPVWCLQSRWMPVEES